MYHTAEGLGCRPMHTPPLWPCEADAVPVRAASVPAEEAAADASDKAELSSTAVAIAGNLRTDPPGERPHCCTCDAQQGELGDNRRGSRVPGGIAPCRRPRSGRRRGTDRQRPAWTPAVVRGAVPRAARCPIPLSIRMRGCPTYDLPMIVMTWLLCLRIADDAAEPVQAVPVEPLLRPRLGWPTCTFRPRFWIIRRRRRNTT